ncbi:MAG: hypothetical protein ACREQ9_11400 [Candidatus Binatia bacterium]
MFFETILEAVLTHPLQVLVAAAVFFFVVCEGLAALPLRKERTEPELPKAA